METQSILLSTRHDLVQHVTIQILCWCLFNQMFQCHDQNILDSISSFLRSPSKQFLDFCLTKTSVHYHSCDDTLRLKDCACATPTRLFTTSSSQIYQHLSRYSQIHGLVLFKMAQQAPIEVGTVLFELAQYVSQISDDSMD